ADLVTADPQRRRLGVHVDVLAAPEPAHHVRQLVFGELEGIALQATEAADDTARDQDGHRDGEEQPDQADGAGDPTLVQAEWLIRWSASRMAFATATPPLYSSCSSVPARCCHWAWLMGSLATGVPATMACSMPARSCCMVPDPASPPLYVARYAGVRM